MMRKYLLVFIQTFQEFRLAELDSLCKMFRISWNVAESHSLSDPVCVIEMPSSDDLMKILNRSICIRFGFEFWAEATCYCALYRNLKKIDHICAAAFEPNQSFCLRLTTTNKKRHQSYGLQRIKELDFLPFEGKVDLDNPSNIFHIVEENDSVDYSSTQPASVDESTDHSVKRVFFGKLIGKGQMTAVTKYNLVDRKYIGNTSMDPILAMIQANLAWAAPTQLVLDPFVGTGSLLIAAAHFGAYCIGTEISYNTVHGFGRSSRHNVKYRGTNETVRANFDQYGLSGKYLDVILADASRSEYLWRWKSSFDSIITDPPYGIREKSLKLGYRKRNKQQEKSVQINLNEGDNNYTHYPEKTKYEFSQVILDLLNFAAEFLVIEGILTYWLPIMNKELIYVIWTPSNEKGDRTENWGLCISIGESIRREIVERQNFCKQ